MKAPTAPALPNSRTKPKTEAASRVDESRAVGAKPQSRTKASRAPSVDEPASHAIEERIVALGDWRAETLSRMRALILATDPEMVEERKWVKPTNPAGVPVWSHAGIVCTGEVYTRVVKLTFARGAALPDPKGLFNASLEGNTRRAIDIHEGEAIDAGAFRTLIKAAVALNKSSTRKR